MKHCYIVGAAPCQRLSFSPGEGDLVIAADGGCAHLLRAQIRPDIMIGDLDSVREIPKDSRVQIHPKEKDETDMLLAIQYGLSKGYRRFSLYGGIGGRLDHTFANLQSLSYLAKHGASGMLIGDHTRATVIRDGEISFDASMQGALSVFAIDEKAEGVCIHGMKYPLQNATLNNSFPLGVSNAFIGKESMVSVRKGGLLLIWLDGS